MDPSLWPLVSAFAGGALIGLVLSVFGGGGSVLATPLLVYVVGVRDPHVAVGTSAAAVAVNAAVGLIAHGRAGRVKWRCAAVFGIPGLAGVLIGAHLSKQMEGDRFMLWFAFAMAAIGLSMLMAKKETGDPAVVLTAGRAVKLVPLGGLTGLAAGFFGIGGGFLIVPCLMVGAGMTIANAAASSLVSVVLFGAATSASYAASGFIDWPVFFALVAGGVLGAVVGMPASKALEGRAAAARRVFALMVLATAGYVAWRSLGHG